MYARNALLMMGSFLGSRLLGLIREQVIASKFGTSPEYDAYLAAFRIPDFLYLVIMGGALGSAMIPLLAEYWARDDSEGAQELASAVLTLGTAAMLLAGTLALIAAEPLMRYVVAPGLTEAELELSISLTRVLLLSPVALGAAGVVMAFLNSRHRYIGPAVAPLAYNGSIIVAAVALAPVYGIYGLAAGVIVGAVLNFGVQLPELLLLGYSLRPSLRWHNPVLRRLLALIFPRLFGQAVYQLNFVVMTAIASGLVAGSISALNYSHLLMMLPHGIFAMSIAVTSFPVMAELVAHRNKAGLQRAVSSALGMVLFLGLPSAIGLSFLGRPVVRLLFESGAFSAGSTEMVVRALTFMAFGVVPYGAVEVLTRVFYALGDTKRPVAVGVITVGANLIMALLLSRSMAHSGLALALVISTTIEMVLLAVLLGRHIGSSWVWELAPSVLRSAASAVVLVLLLWAAITLDGEFLSGHRNLQSIIGLVLTVSCGAAVYLGMSLALGSPEAAMLTKVPKQLFHGEGSASTDGG